MCTLLSTNAIAMITHRCKTKDLIDKAFAAQNDPHFPAPNEPSTICNCRSHSSSGWKLPAASVKDSKTFVSVTGPSVQLNFEGIIGCRIKPSLLLQSFCTLQGPASNLRSWPSCVVT